MRYAILSAVSSKKQTEGTSLEDQISICRKMSERGWQETAGPYIVRGQNRTQYLNLRDAEEEIKALRDLLEDARRRTYDVLVVYDHDRLRDLLSLVYASLGDYGVQLFSMSAQNMPVPPDEYDPYENDANDLMIGISAIRSKAEIARMRRKYRTGMRNRILIHHLPVQIPFGYRRPLAEHYNRKAIPEPNPALAVHIIEIKDRLLKGQSIAQLKEYLKEQHVPPPRGNTWHLQTIRDMLKNPFYAGIVQFEKSKVIKDRRNKKKSRDRNPPRDKIISSKGNHRPLWDEATHTLITKEIARRARNFKGRKNNQFTAILRCGECGATLWRYKNGPRDVPERFIWRCSEDHTGHPSITHVDLLQRVGKQLQNSLAELFQARQSAPPTDPAKIKDSAILEELRAERSRIELMFQKGMISFANFEKRAAEVDEKIHTYEDDRTRAQDRAIQKAHIRSYLMHNLGAQAAHLPAWLEHNDPPETNRLLHLLLENITVNAETIELNFR